MHCCVVCPVVALLYIVVVIVTYKVDLRRVLSQVVQLTKEALSKFLRISKNSLKPRQGEENSGIRWYCGLNSMAVAFCTSMTKTNDDEAYCQEDCYAQDNWMLGRRFVGTCCSWHWTAKLG